MRGVPWLYLIAVALSGCGADQEPPASAAPPPPRPETVFVKSDGTELRAECGSGPVLRLLDSAEMLVISGTSRGAIGGPCGKVETPAGEAGFVRLAGLVATRRETDRGPLVRYARELTPVFTERSDAEPVGHLSANEEIRLEREDEGWGEITGGPFDGKLVRLNQLKEELTPAERRQMRELEERATRLAREAEEEQALERRKRVEDELRTRYLDEGLDIKVDVSGKRYDRITLTYVLFNDVWLHRFQKDGGLEALRNMGFRRVDLTDGYNYHKYWKLD